MLLARPMLSSQEQVRSREKRLAWSGHEGNTRLGNAVAKTNMNTDDKAAEEHENSEIELLTT